MNTTNFVSSIFLHHRKNSLLLFSVANENLLKASVFFKLFNPIGDSSPREDYFSHSVIWPSLNTKIFVKANSKRKKYDFLNVGLKLFYLGIFGLKPEKVTVPWFFHISTLKFFQTKFCSKIKILNFGTKIVLIRYFGLEFQKTNVEFEISILEFINIQSFT